MVHRFESAQFIPRARAELFPFFADAGNLERITPPFMNFRIITPLPVEIVEGALIDYRIKLFGVPMKWRTRIETWRPNEHFVDLQLRGPYRLWRHLHEFSDQDGGTRMRDVVDYELPLGPLASPVHPLFVRPLIERIFAYRREVIEREFPARP